MSRVPHPAKSRKCPSTVFCTNAEQKIALNFFKKSRYGHHSVNATERDLGTSIRFPVKIASRDITSIMAAPSIPLKNIFKVGRSDRPANRQAFGGTVPLFCGLCPSNTITKVGRSDRPANRQAFVGTVPLFCGLCPSNTITKVGRSDRPANRQAFGGTVPLFCGLCPSNTITKVGRSDRPANRQTFGGTVPLFCGLCPSNTITKVGRPTTYVTSPSFLEVVVLFVEVLRESVQVATEVNHSHLILPRDSLLGYSRALYFEVNLGAAGSYNS